MTIEVKSLTCKRCGYTWFPRINSDGKTIIPKNCASKKCKSPYWNKEKRLFKTASTTRTKKSLAIGFLLMAIVLLGATNSVQAEKQHHHYTKNNDLKEIISSCEHSGGVFKKGECNIQNEEEETAWEDFICDDPAKHKKFCSNPDNFDDSNDNNKGDSDNGENNHKINIKKSLPLPALVTDIKKSSPIVTTQQQQQQQEQQEAIDKDVFTKFLQNAKQQEEQYKQEKIAADDAETQKKIEENSQVHQRLVETAQAIADYKHKHNENVENVENGDNNDDDDDAGDEPDKSSAEASHEEDKAMKDVADKEEQEDNNNDNSDNESDDSDNNNESEDKNDDSDDDDSNNDDDSGGDDGGDEGSD